MCNLDRIIDKCKQGDRQAAEKIYQIFSAKMFALCLRFSKDRADAEDTLQDGFIKIFTSIGQYTGKGSFEGWMKRIMINTAMEKFRKNPHPSCQFPQKMLYSTRLTNYAQIPLDIRLQRISVIKTGHIF